MRRFGLAVLVISLTAATPAVAQLVAPTLANPQPAAPKKKPAAETPARTCPEYGAGYVRLDSGTCVKVGGYVRFQAGAGPR